MEKTIEKNKKNGFWSIQTVAVMIAMAAIMVCSVSAIMYHNAWFDVNSRLEKSMKENSDLKIRIANATDEIEKLKKRQPNSAAEKPKTAAATLTCGKPGTIANRLNNPCNVKAPVNGGRWKGQLGVDKQKHVHFQSVYHGIRAAAITLRSYYVRHGIKTVSGIIDRFCGGNPGYVKFLCAEMGLKPDQEFNVVDRIPELVWLMSQYESGKRLPGDCLVTLDLVKGTN